MSGINELSQSAANEWFKDPSIEEIEVLNLLGEPASVSGKEIAFFCPKCNPPHHKPKLFVNRDTFQYHCFVCGFRGNGNKSLARSMGKNIKYGKSNSEDSIVDEVRKIFSNKNNHSKIKADWPSGLVSIFSAPAYQVRPAIDYLNKRDINKNDILRLRLMYGFGFDSNFSLRGRIVFPSFDKDGDPNFFVGRATWPEPEKSEFYMKYKQGPYDISPKNIIFNELNIDWNYPIVLTEGPFDAARIFNSVPLLGKSVHPKWELFKKIVQKNQPIILCLDSDAAEEQKRIAKLFDFYGVSDIKMVQLPKGEDAGSVKRTDLKDYLHKAVPYINDCQGFDILEKIKNGSKKTPKKTSPLGII